MSKFTIFFKGIFIGVANIIPGLSGGTIAVLFGVYETLIKSISNLLKLRYLQSQYSFYQLWLLR